MYARRVEAALVTIFILGYVAIAFEQQLGIDKAASALLTGVTSWAVYILSSADKDAVALDLMRHFGNFSGILFFLLGAMTIVELIDANDGFEVITSRIRTTNKRTLLWIISLLTFFLSAALDNLTTAIVVTSMTRKMVRDGSDRLLFVGMIVIAANAGGAWSPIGDVTTTMLWIGGQITTGNIIAKLLAPSLICLLAPLTVLSFSMKGTVAVAADETLAPASTPRTTASERKAVFFSGLGLLILVPVFKTATHLPPFMGMLLALGLVWVIVECVHRGKPEQEKHPLSVVRALRRIDVPSILFFLGILIAIAALENTGLLERLARVMEARIGNTNLIVIAIGLLSAIVDNVPLVAATMGMYDLSVFPPDHYLWEFIAYCAGTGGSLLIIGTAAGVAVMGIEKIDFFWYVKRIGWLAALGYFAGALAFIGQDLILAR
jgi:Na+/H+ antiporter NhaD/arsenite permease-like protein